MWRSGSGLCYPTTAGTTLPLRGIVSRDLSGDILMGWRDCAQWGLLSQEYFASCSRVESSLKPEEKEKSTLDKIKMNFEGISTFQKKHFDLAKSLFISSFIKIFADNLVNKDPIKTDSVKIQYKEN